MQMLLVGGMGVIRTLLVLQQVKKLRLWDKRMAVLHQQNKMMARRQGTRGMCGCHKSLSPS